MADLSEGLLYFVVFLLSTTLHEAAHAWAALRGGDPTAYRGGQVSIDPRPHIRREPVGMLLLPLPPLDGSAALPLLMGRRLAAGYQELLWSTPMVGWLGMMAAWQLCDVVFDPVFARFASLVYPGVTYG